MAIATGWGILRGEGFPGVCYRIVELDRVEINSRNREATWRQFDASLAGQAGVS